jgi:hypothetical protein
LKLAEQKYTPGRAVTMIESIILLYSCIVAIHAETLHIFALLKRVFSKVSNSVYEVIANLLIFQASSEQESRNGKIKYR